MKNMPPPLYEYTCRVRFRLRGSTYTNQDRERAVNGTATYCSYSSC